MDINTTNWEMLINAIAVKFADLIKDLMNDEVLEEIVKRNKSESMPNVCHTHDFCDANMLMNDAIKNTVDGWENNSASWFQKVWDQSWQRAKENEFYTKKPDQS